MALVLSLRVGDDFYIAEEQFVCSEQLDGHEFMLTRTSNGCTYKLESNYKVELMPDVLAYAGRGRSRG